VTWLYNCQGAVLAFIVVLQPLTATSYCILKVLSRHQHAISSSTLICQHLSLPGQPSIHFSLFTLFNWQQ